MKRLFFIAIVALVFACISKKSGLERFPEIREIFTSEEIADLNTIVDFYDEIVCEQVQAEQVPDCYAAYLQMLTEAVEAGSNDPGVPYEAQKELLESIQPSTFREIWNAFADTTGHAGVMESFNLSYQRKYGTFLKAVGRSDERILAYFNRLAAVGAITGGLTLGLLSEYPNFDFSDERIRLIYAIHYLTLNGQYGILNGKEPIVR